LLLTGTPEGISQVKPGDLLEAQLSYEGKILATIKEDVVKEDPPKIEEA
jgi:2-keto-4-pentenoate hydratase/2-oxohepta-3-ene-1,7-dioic acid hydratase in catechol pathway